MYTDYHVHTEFSDDSNSPIICSFFQEIERRKFQNKTGNFSLSTNVSFCVMIMNVLL